MDKQYEIFDHTADIGIVAYGDKLSDVFSNAAYGMFSLMTDLDNVRLEERRECSVKGADFEALLVTWLNELIYLFETERIIFKCFDVSIENENTLSSVCYGEKVNTEVHEFQRGIKAATYHKIRISEDTNGMSACIIFDI